MSIFKNCIPSLLSCCYCNKSHYKWEDTPYISLSPESYQVPLIQFQLPASHNTFLRGVQICGFATQDAIIKTLNMGARFIELDIFADKNNNPIVVHGDEASGFKVSSTLSYGECCEKIAHYAWKNTELPLFISLEINEHNKELYDAIANDTLETFENIYTPPCHPDTCLGELKNKVVFIISRPLIIDSTIFNNLFKNRFYTNSWTKMPYTDIKEYDFTQNKLTMIYPKNIFYSTNYDTTSALEKGMNFVCLNWQTNDKYFKQYAKYFKHFIHYQK